LHTSIYTLGVTLLGLGYLNIVGTLKFLPINLFLIQESLQSLQHGVVNHY